MAGEDVVDVEVGQRAQRGPRLLGVVGGRRRDDPGPAAPVVGVEGDQGVAGQQRPAPGQVQDALAVGVTGRVQHLHPAGQRQRPGEQRLVRPHPGHAQGAGGGWATHICDVEVDRETGQVKILRYTAVQDVGRAIHPSYVEGQIQGGVTQGIGWARNEEYIYDKNGRLDNPGFLDYRVPVASDLPMIEAVMVEVPNPRHPFGAKGVGEVPIVPPMAAVANAIADAIGIRMRDLPMSPPRLPSSLCRR